MHALFLAPTGFGGGLNSVSLGLIRALQQAGLKVGFFKPIAQPFPVDQGRERSCLLVERTLGLSSPEPLALAQVERQLADGELDLLLEDVVSRYQQAAAGKDVVIVEGMVPTRDSDYAARINTHLAKSLDAEIILVAAQGSDSLKQMAERIEIQAQMFGGAKDPKVLGTILNKVKSEDTVPAFVERLQQQLPLLGSETFQLLGAVPFAEELNALRTHDVAEALGAKVLNAGEAEQRRVGKIILCARTVPNMVQLLQPGVLVVTPGDRDDIILAACLASLNGVKLAGLLLTGDFGPDQRVLDLCKAALDGGLPLLSVNTGSFETASNLSGLNKETPADDIERASRVTDFIAQHLRPEYLHARCSLPRELRMSPAAFRYLLVKRAQDANKRIVLPEGNEPRTVRAAAICQERGIARCVLLAKPEEVAAVAREQGISLPADLEILDPDSIRAQYVGPMVEMRKSKGLTPEMADEQLKDTVVLGTMMLALDEVDGLVSGAVHTTANTIRPALQLIKTAPGYNLVSSVFFMLLPDQVLVYGDCAVNPNPNARAGRDRPAERRVRRGPRRAPARGDDQLLHRRLRQRRGSGQGTRGHPHRSRAQPWPADRRPAAVRRRVRAQRRQAEGTEQPRRRPGHRVRVPRPQHRQHHLQGGTAQRQLPQRRPDAAGPGQAGERPVARRAGGRHRLHHRPHRTAGRQHGRAEAESAGPADRSLIRLAAAGMRRRRQVGATAD